MSLPSCYGIFWEGVASTPQCYDQCGAKQECLAKFATKTLAKYQRELGDSATVQRLAEVTSVKPEAILLALDYQNNMVKAQASQQSSAGPSTPPAADAIPVPMPPPVALAQDGVPAPPPVPDSGVMCDPADDISHPDKPEADAQEAPEIEEAPAAKKSTRKKKTAPQKEGAAPKKAPATKAAPKKKAPPKKAVTANFQKAGAAKRAAAPAKEPGSPKRWSEEQNLARFHRERERNPLIRRLPVGYVLQRTWPYQDPRGPIHRVIVGRRSYRYQDREYPTLYAVVQAIAGVKEYGKQMRIPGQEDSRPEGKKLSTSWSVTKFFGLDKLILSLEEERQGKGKCSPPKWKWRSKKKRPAKIKCSKS
ncbi:MAG: hypothetical protein A2Y61_00375 [Chloroflexi bacterium RBG_13_60_13]|nr:MAG: hypothetical protein A2Y61_00375 [Chloroflexi bacterium RBG_13_60_13]